MADIHEMMGNLVALMNVIIQYDDANPPILWQQLMEIDRVLRSPEGKAWTDWHRNTKEVIFNVVQDLQSTVAGFVAEARKYGFKNLVKTGVTISPNIFTLALKQSGNIQSNLLTTMLTMTAGTYKESTVLYNICDSEPGNKKREAPADSSSSTSPTKRINNDRPTNANSSNQPATSGGGNSNPVTTGKLSLSMLTRYQTNFPTQGQYSRTRTAITKSQSKLVDLLDANSTIFQII